jgi:hypothetical protein
VSKLRIFILYYVISICHVALGKQCNCIIYKTTLKELNKELSSIKSLIVSTDTIVDPTVGSLSWDTIYYTKSYQQRYKFFISDKIVGSEYSASSLSKIYQEITNDSIYKLNNYAYNEPVNLYGCKFNNADSILFLTFDNTNNFELREKAFSSYSTKIIHSKNHNDTINYSPIIIHFSNVAYLNNEMAFFYISYDFSHRQFARSVLFRKVKKKWLFYKFGKESQF